MPTRSLHKQFRSARYVCVALVLLLLLVDVAAAQDRYERIARQHDRPQLFHEAVVLPGGVSAQVVISFRIPNGLLVFVRQDGAFAAHPNVKIDLYRDGSKIGDRIWRGAHVAASFEATQDNARDLEGRVVFDLPPGRYEYALFLNDEAARTVGAESRTSFVVPDLERQIVGRPFFAHVHVGPDHRVRADLANLNGSVPFGERVPVVIPAAAIAPGDRFDYRLYRIDRDRHDAESDHAYEPASGDDLLSEGRLELNGATNMGVVDAACLCWRSTEEVPGRLVTFDLDTESLENDTYLLEVEMTQSDGSRDKTSLIFQSLWRDMPLSLYDIEVAIRNLEFIESRDRIREMLRGSRNERVQRFRAYWKDRDPSPATPFNELMSEYYRRIDVAAHRFQSGKTPYPDGLRTDAARIYVIHGPPDDVSSSFPSEGGVVQVWTYRDGRQFSFWAASSLDPLQLRHERVPRSSSEEGS